MVATNIITDVFRKTENLLMHTWKSYNNFRNRKLPRLSNLGVQGVKISMTTSCDCIDSDRGACCMLGNRLEEIDSRGPLH